MKNSDKRKRSESKMAISIVDVANELGISAATVSRALSDHPRISELTKQRVRDKATELGYVHNRMASSLRNSKSGIVGLIVPRISMFFHAEFITFLQNQLQKAGYQLMIAQSNDISNLEKDLINSMFSSRVDALVLAISLNTTEYHIFDRFIKHDIPIVFYDRVPLTPIPFTYSVVGDDFSGGYMAAIHLAEQNARNIACISGPLNSNIYRDRTLGFLKGLQEKGITVNQDWIFHHELTAENTVTSLKKLFENETYPDGLFVGNDNTAIHTLQYLNTRGITVPKQIKIMGYSNDPRGSIIQPSITTIDQHPHLMAQNVCNVLLKILHKKTTDVPVSYLPVITPVDIIMRQSSM